jgi:cation-transporting ATPase 13A1
MNTMGEPLAIALEQMKKTQVDDRLKEFDDWGSSEDEDEEEADEDELEAVESTADATKKAAIKDPSLDDDERPLPSAYLPNAWAAACTLFLVLGHALFHLMCHWSTKFRVAALFTKDTRLEVGSCMHVVPHAHKGKSAVCAITRSRRTKHLEFMFQRQKYEVFLPGDAPEPEEDEPPLVGGGEVGTVRFSHSPVNLVLHDYLGAKGLDAEQVALRYERYGKNSLSLKPPTLPSLLLQQLISPISIFQLFSSLLWLLDAYWQYMVFTCFTLCIMSGTTAFQRLRTMKVHAVCGVVVFFFSFLASVAR